LDFLVKDRISQQVSHIELAVKLFLCEELHDESEDAAHWIGPEGVDRLDLKLQKLREHQIPLLHSEESQSLLKSRWGLAPETIQSFVLIKGYGFVSRTDWKKRSKSHWLAAKNIIGTWKRVSEPSDSSQDALPELPALPKNQWLGFRGEPDSDVPAWGFTVHDEWPKPSHPTHPLFTASGFV
jgi:hypothetical protein